MTAMKERIRVWDPLVRIIHWLLLAAFITSYLTGEEDTDYHFYSGYLILTLIALRVVWGFIGSENARFSSFLASPTAAVGYLRGLVSGRARHYVGHNPAAAVMMVALLTSLLLTAFAGLMIHGYHGNGPLAFIVAPAARPADQDAAGQPETEREHRGEREREHDDDDEDEEWQEYREHDDEREAYREREEGGAARREAIAEREQSGREGRRRMSREEHEREEIWEELHEFFANFTILLIVLHVAGALASSWRHNENLVKSMIDGYKEQDSGTSG